MAYVGSSEAVAALTPPSVPSLVPDRCADFAFWRKLASCPEGWLKKEHQTTPKEQVKKSEWNIVGLSGFAIWRGVYFTKLFSYRNRFNVATDWMRAFFFGRTVASPVQSSG